MWADIPAEVPERDLIVASTPAMVADGGSCIAAPDGSWAVAPVVGEEALIVEVLHHEIVRRERQNFDPSGHYARPDVLQLTLNQTRQSVLRIE